MFDVLKFLTELGIEYKPGGSENVKIRCLNPNHNDKDPSMYVHKETGAINCFSCHLHGGLRTILHLKGIQGIDAIQFFQKFSKGGDTQEEKRKELENFVDHRQKVIKGEIETKEIEVELPPHRKIESNSYLESRGITKEEILYWNMGIITGGMNLGSVIIPIIQDGKLQNYFIRGTFNKKKFYGPYPVDNLLFGLDSALDTSKSIYIVEGIFDMIFFRRTRRQCVAVLTNRISKYKKDILKRYKEVIVVPDNDQGGKTLVKSATSLIHNTKVKVCSLPSNKKDSAECTLDELLHTIYKEVSIQDFSPFF